MAYETNMIEGLIEIHKYIRKFYVSLLDDEILDEDEKQFFRFMDRLQLRSYLAIRSVEKFPEAYQARAKELLERMAQGEQEYAEGQGPMEDEYQQQGEESSGR